MTYSTYPALPSTALPDSSKYSYELEDGTIANEMEGSYTVTRARSTRRKRKTFKISYTYIDGPDKAVIEAHYEAVSGGAVIFQWTNPEDDVVYLVRFKGVIAFTYKGRGLLRRWDCSFDLQQA